MSYHFPPHSHPTSFKIIDNQQLTKTLTVFGCLRKYPSAGVILTRYWLSIHYKSTRWLWGEKFYTASKRNQAGSPKVIPKGRKIPSGIHVDFAGDGDFLAHRFITHNSQLLTKIVLFLRRTRLYSFFTVFTAKACPAGMPGAPHCFVRAISKKSAEQFAEQLAEGQKGADTKQINLFCSRLLRNLACGHLYCCASAKQINLFCSRLLRIFAPLLEFII